MTQIDQLLARIRPEVLALEAYVSAREGLREEDGYIFLDANECAFEPYVGAKGYARYSAQRPAAALKAMASLYDVSSSQLLITRGADEGIELLVRTLCNPGKDNIIVCPPAFSMYDQSALLHNTEIRSVPLMAERFDLDVAGIKAVMDENTKLLFLCSPNNPTANIIGDDALRSLLEATRGQALVVVDEAYVDFTAHAGYVGWLADYPNLVILRTFSKSQAAAGVRCGALIAHPKMVAMVAKVLAPYPVPEPVVEAILNILKPKNQERISAKIAEVIETRNWLAGALVGLLGIEKIYPSETNFLLLKVDDGAAFCQRVRELGFIIRNQSSQQGLMNHVRVSVGTPDQMHLFVQALKSGQRPLSADQRRAEVVRKTAETAISCVVNLDQTGPISIKTGIGFYDHMLEQVAKHGGFSLELECEGDLEVDPHHTVEDCAIALGQAMRQALGDKSGIGRYGFVIPMDEALADCALDLSGRFHLEFSGNFPESMVGDLPTDMVAHIFRSFAENLGATLHIAVKGENSHHMVEGCFKALGRSLRQAIGRGTNPQEMPSTKGVLA